MITYADSIAKCANRTHSTNAPVTANTPHSMHQIKPVATKPIPKTRKSRGGFDEINPDDVIYGEYARSSQHGEYLDVIYRDDDVLRCFSGPIVRPCAMLDELAILLYDEEQFYVTKVRELERGFAFKHTDITTIETTSLVEGNANHPPSCTWTIHFKNSKPRGVEIGFQSYFVYANTSRPPGHTNAKIVNWALGIK